MQIAREMTDEMTIRLEQVDPARNRYRVYRITPCCDLFGALCLIVEWGRRGNPLRWRSEVFADSSAREARIEEILTLRRKHNYCIV